MSSGLDWTLTHAYPIVHSDIPNIRTQPGGERDAEDTTLALSCFAVSRSVNSCSRKAFMVELKLKVGLLLLGALGGLLGR